MTERIYKFNLVLTNGKEAPGYKIDTDGNVYGPQGPLARQELNSPYPYVSVYNKDKSKSYQFRIDKALLSSYTRKPFPEHFDIFFVDGNPKNLNIDNLWGIPKYIVEMLERLRERGAILDNLQFKIVKCYLYTITQDEDVFWQQYEKGL
ncbi:MAG: hypothetical protein GX132_01480 [Erysipelotrichia bacterium]|jgi:hypothetical protein|nr:hypothetical protein [Erysipelotrichia bacterium]